MDINQKVNLICIVLFMVVIYLYLIKINTIEGFSAVIDSTAMQNIASIYNNKKLIVDTLEIKDKLVMNDKPIYLRGGNDAYHTIQYDPKYDGPSIKGNRGVNLQTVMGIKGNGVNINGGNLKVHNGSRFNGDRHLFKDSEKSDGTGLRVGSVWGKYGIYAELGSVVLGSAGNKFAFQTTDMGEVTGDGIKLHNIAMITDKKKQEYLKNNENVNISLAGSPDGNNIDKYGFNYCRILRENANDARFEHGGCNAGNAKDNHLKWKMRRMIIRKNTHPLSGHPDGR